MNYLLPASYFTNEPMNQIINFHSKATKFYFRYQALTRKLLVNVFKNENKKPGNINIIFCSDDFILNLNRKFLNHDYFTDVIAFNYSDDNFIAQSNINSVNGDIFISIDTVKQNAHKYNTTLKNELMRVIIHAALHLIGYDDSDKSKRNIMSLKEDYYLSLQ